MTEQGKNYWIRKIGSVGPGQKHGLLLGTNRQKKVFWTIKTGCANAYLGGVKLDTFLANNTDTEAVEVVESGTRKYHGQILKRWIPVATQSSSNHL